MPLTTRILMQAASAKCHESRKHRLKVLASLRQSAGTVLRLLQALAAQKKAPVQQVWTMQTEIFQVSSCLFCHCSVLVTVSCGGHVAPKQICGRTFGLTFVRTSAFALFDGSAKRSIVFVFVLQAVQALDCLAAWVRIDCWNSSQEASIMPLLASLPTRRALELLTTHGTTPALLGMKKRAAEYLSSLFDLCGSPRTIPAATDGLLSLLVRLVPAVTYYSQMVAASFRSSMGKKVDNAAMDVSVLHIRSRHSLHL